MAKEKSLPKKITKQAVKSALEAFITAATPQENDYTDKDLQKHLKDNDKVLAEAWIKFYSILKRYNSQPEATEFSDHEDWNKDEFIQQVLDNASPLLYEAMMSCGIDHDKADFQDMEVEKLAVYLCYNTISYKDIEIIKNSSNWESKKKLIEVNERLITLFFDSHKRDLSVDECKDVIEQDLSDEEKKHIRYLINNHSNCNLAITLLMDGQIKELKELVEAGVLDLNDTFYAIPVDELEANEIKLLIENYSDLGINLSAKNIFGQTFLELIQLLEKELCESQIKSSCVRVEYASGGILVGSAAALGFGYVINTLPVAESYTVLQLIAGFIIENKALAGALIGVSGLALISAAAANHYAKEIAEWKHSPKEPSENAL